MDLLERARRYLERMDPSVSGSGGHTAAFKAAVALVQGFDLSEGQALGLLQADFNPRCDPEWSERELLHKVRQADRAGGAGGKARGYLLKGGGSSSSGSSSRPGPASSSGAIEVERNHKRPEFDQAALERAQAAGFSPEEAWLAERSPVDPRDITAGEFLDAIFPAGEKTLIFTNFYGQGDFGHVAGQPGESYRIGQRPGIRPEPAELPQVERVGAWFLPVPMDGKWHASGGVDKKTGLPLRSRRSGKSVMSWRHLVLESDEARDEEWLNLLCQLPLPVSALYTSGGRSIHALIRIDARSKGRFDEMRDRMSPFLAKLGADPAAMTGVRLTSLPGVFRCGTEKVKQGRREYVRYKEPRLQRLLYLDPDPEVRALQFMPRLRKVKGVRK